jgi:hypothetical protein
MSDTLSLAYNELLESISAPVDNNFDADYWSDILKKSQPLLKRIFQLSSYSNNSVIQPMNTPSLSSVAIKIAFQGTIKMTKSLPQTIPDLFTLIQSTFHLPTPSFSDFELFFTDSDGEKCMIETDPDLYAAYTHARNFSDSCLKTHLEYKHALTDRQKWQKWAECFRNDGDIARKRKFKERQKLREYSFMKGNCIVRDGYVYEKFKRVDHGRVIYRWEDYLKFGCKGRWIAKVTAYGGEYGELDWEHTYAPEMHSCNMNEEIMAANPHNLGKKQNVQLSKQDVKKFIAALIMKSPAITRNEVIAEIKSCVAHADLPPKVEIEYMLQKLRNALTPGIAGYGLINIENLKTLRGTQFGRELSMSVIENLPRLFLYLYSEWQEAVVKEVQEKGDLHLYVDIISRWCPKMFKVLMNISVFDGTKKAYIPIGHACIQTKKKEGYLVALKWFKDKFDLNPRYVTCDFDSALIEAIHETFDNKNKDLDVKPWFFQFWKSIWFDAIKKGLNNPEYINSTKSLLLGLQSLCFVPEGEMIDKFVLFQEGYSRKSKLFEEFLIEFTEKWTEGIYQPKYWSFCGLEDEIENLITANNSMEGFYHIIRTQLPTARPNVAAFVEVMSRVETLKKSEYESEYYPEETQVSASSASQLSVIWETQPLKNLALNEETAPIKGEKIWPSTIIMRYLRKIRGQINVNEHGEVTDKLTILQEEFLAEHSDEILTSFIRPKKQEDTVKDILAQENLWMNLNAL